MSIEAEQGVLGSIMLSPDTTIDGVIEVGITPESFYDLRNQTLFGCIMEMHNSNLTIDALTLAEYIKDGNNLDKVGGYDYLVELQDSALVPAHSKHYCEIVIEKRKLRLLIEHASDAIEKAFKSEVAMDISSGLALEADKIAMSGSDERTNNQIAIDVLDLDRKIMAGEPVGLPFPWRKLQKATNGVPFSAVSPLAGRDGKGKSRLATWLGVHWACSGFPGMTFPFEDTEIRCLRNMACALGEYDAFKLSQPYLPDAFKDMHEKAVHRAAKLPMYICDYAHRIEQIISQIATHKRKYGIRWVIIDGFKDIASSGGENRTQEEVRIMRALTACARKYKVAIIPIMHINKIEDDRWISKQFITGSGDQTKSARMTMIYQDHIPPNMKDNIAPDCYDDNLFALDAQKTSYGTPCVMPLIKELEKGRFVEYEQLVDDGGL